MASGRDREREHHDRVLAQELAQDRHWFLLRAIAFAAALALIVVLSLSLALASFYDPTLPPLSVTSAALLSAILLFCARVVKRSLQTDRRGRFVNKSECPRHGSRLRMPAEEVTAAEHSEAARPTDPPTPPMRRRAPLRAPARLAARERH